MPRALSLAVQIAEALDHAHRRGITHRDLKPSNIMLTRSGVKLLDFGLGKWVRLGSGAISGPQPTEQPTLGSDAELTRKGTILGTLHYMAPEQLEGRETDSRSDIFSFGTVLYEMLAGRKAFEGSSQAGVIAAILTSQPPLVSSLHGTVPARIDRVIVKCLAKDPDLRWQSARDLADELRWALDDLTRPEIALRESGGPPAPAGSRSRGLAAAGAIAVIAAVSALVGWMSGRAPQTETTVNRSVGRFLILPPASAPLAQSVAGTELDISPDGHQVVYNVLEPGSGSGRLYLRRLDQFDAVPLPGTAGAFPGVFSPDGKWVAFAVRDSSGAETLAKIDSLTPVSPIVLSKIPGAIVGGSLSWLGNDALAFGVVGRKGLYRVSSEGGDPQAISEPDEETGEQDHHSSQLLPGAGALLLTVHDRSGSFHIAAQPAGSNARRTVIESGFDAHYSETGHIVFARGTSILAVPFDLEQLQVTGSPVVLVEHVATTADDGSGNFRLSSSGTLMYVPARSMAGRRLTWVSSPGVETLVPVAPRAFTSPAVSRDGRRLAFALAEGDRRDIWIYEPATDTLTRATVEGDNFAPIWSPDSQRLTYTSLREGMYHLMWQPTDGSRPAESLVSNRYVLIAGAWTSDNRTFLYSVQSPAEDGDIMAVRLDGDRRPEPLIELPGGQRFPRLSPDGRWLAFVSTETKRTEVYVTAFPAVGTRRPISTEGGREPAWSADGRQIFFRSGTRMFAAPVDASGSFSFGKPRVLFDAPYVINNVYGLDYSIAPDGRFLMVKPDPDEQIPSRIAVVLNWTDELLRRVPPASR